MKLDVRDQLPEYVLAVLPPAEMDAIADAIANDPALAREADALEGSLALVAARLLGTIATPERFAPFLAPLAQLLQLSLDKVRAVLARIDDPTVFEKGLPGVGVFHFDAGPTLAGADAGLIRFEPGVRFPKHRHLVGRETTFVLEGGLIDDDRVYGPGSVVVHEPGFVHFCGATQDRPLLMMIVHYGIEPVFD